AGQNARGGASPARALSKSEVKTLNQLRVHRDIRIQQTRNRAALLRVLSRFLELRLIGARNLHAHIQMNRRHGESRVGLLERERRLRVDRLGGHARVPQLAGKRHAEASRVGGGDQFLGVGSRAVLKTGGEGILRVLQDAAGGRNRALSIFQTAGPVGACCTYHVVDLLWNYEWIPGASCPRACTYSMYDPG